MGRDPQLLSLGSALAPLGCLVGFWSPSGWEMDVRPTRPLLPDEASLMTGIGSVAAGPSPNLLPARDP